jgi:agmatine deiminase
VSETTPPPGFRLPAEWERHQATWLAWPRLAADWSGKLSAVEWAHVEMIRHLAPGEEVRLLVPSPAVRRKARRMIRDAGVDLRRVRFFTVPSDRSWMRDTGPIFVASVQNRRSLRIAHFQFNAWARYPDWKKDARIPARLARRLGIRLLPVRHRGRLVVLEGGAIDVNGRGAILTTEECLLDRRKQVRNRGMSCRDYEKIFRDALGASHTIWLGRGIAGDDTHGHVDDLARFVAPDILVACRETRRRDPNHRALAENWERLQSCRLENGRRPRVVALPMPAPLWFQGQRLPASYANFYIGNAAVLVPTFNDPADRRALGILSECFRDRPVIGIHAADLVVGLGTLHCRTQQQPAT